MSTQGTDPVDNVHPKGPQEATDGRLSSDPGSKFTLDAAKEPLVEEWLTRYPTKRAVLIPLLHLCQKQQGWVSPGVIEYCAARLGLDTSIVQGVVTFYTMYHQHKVAPNVIWVCRTLSCELRGAKEIEEHLCKRLQCDVGKTSPNGKFTLLRAECLAACGQAPMIQLNDEYFENLTIEELDKIIDDYEKKTNRGAA